jgi:hypothetical protein
VIGSRRRSSACALLGAALLVPVAAAPAAAVASPGLRPAERRALLRPVYDRLRADPSFRARERAVDARDRAELDAWLAALPISPLDYLEIDQLARRYEVAVPRFVHDQHLRWLALHAGEARPLYGDRAVDEALRGWAEGTGADDAAAPPPASAAAAATGSVGVNRNVAAGADLEPLEYQGEIQLAVDPSNSARIVAAANTWDDAGGTCGDFGMQAVFHSSDGGVTWGYSCAPDAEAYGLSCTGELGGLGTFGSDPALAWDASGKVYLNYMLLCAVTASDLRFAMVVASSADGGETWSARGIVKDGWETGDVEDKNFYAVDRFPTSPFHGRHYTCWDRIVGTPEPGDFEPGDQRIAYSTSSGATWTEVDLPAPSQGNSDIGCELAIADDGTVHVIWNRLTCNASACTNERMFASRSTDGGAHWTTPVLVHDFNLLSFDASGDNCPSAQDERCLNAFGSLAVDNSGGPCRGTLYAVFTDVPVSSTAEKSNVYVRRSDDGGESWTISGGGVVNTDSATSFKAQFHPWVEVDRGTGLPVVGWHDTRFDSAADQVEFWMGRSADCGATWTDQAVSRPSSEFNNDRTDAPAHDFSDLFTADNVKANPNQYGEYLGLDVDGGRAFMAWTDSRHFFPSFTAEPQKENVGFVEVRFPEIFRDGFQTGDLRLWKVGSP